MTAADQDQGTPPTAAVTKASGRSPNVPKTCGTNGQMKLLQKGTRR